MDNFEGFFASAKKACLSAKESAACRAQILGEMQKNPVRALGTECLTEHMTDLDPSLIHSAQSIQLSAEETARAHSALQSFMQQHPVDMAAAIQKREAQHGTQTWRAFFLWRSTPALAAITLLVLGGGSLSYAAEFALPGDALYPVKIHVNEEVEGALALSTEAKASWETTRAERRIQEAKQLADAGRLTPEKTATLVAAFNAHIAAAHHDIQAIADTGNRNDADTLTKHAEHILRTQKASLESSQQMAVMLHNVERATEQTVALDSSIHSSIALNTFAAPMAAMRRGDNASATENSDTTDSSATSAHFLAWDQHTNRMMMHTNQGDDTTATDDQRSIVTLPGAMKMMGVMKVHEKEGARSSVTITGSGSSSQKRENSGSSLHSSVSDTPITVDIKKDGTIDMQIDGQPTDEHTSQHPIKW